MPVVSVDQDKLNEIMRVKLLVKGSINGVMDGTLTAGHLASDIQLLLDLLDGLQASPVVEGAQPQPAAQTAPPPAEQPVPQPEQPQPEPIQVEQPQLEQPIPGSETDEIPITVDIPETPIQDE